ncbi:MAG: hypothetical protein IJL09_03575 [Lachnospiraceae bacterium]|nr:hypothetical protein [Lachnospiraceae bacterium]
MITRKEIDLSKPLTEAQKKMLEEMNANPAIPDDDCPEFTEAETVHMMIPDAKEENAMDAFDDIKTGLEQAIQYEKGESSARRIGVAKGKYQCSERF